MSSKSTCTFQSNQQYQRFDNISVCNGHKLEICLKPIHLAEDYTPSAVVRINLSVGDRIQLNHYCRSVAEDLKYSM